MLVNSAEHQIHRKILLAEDDDSMRRFIEVILKRENYKVFLAKDGLEALEIALSNDIDIVITDAVMPNMTGFDLCRILRQTPEKKHIPLILLSGFERKDEVNSDKNPADFYVMKQSNLKEELVELLAEIFSKQSD